jgi:hypothetical protein
MKPEGVDNLLVYLLRFYESKIEPHVLFLEDFKLEAIPPDFSRIIGCKDVVLRKNRWVMMLLVPMLLTCVASASIDVLTRDHLHLCDIG